MYIIICRSRRPPPPTPLPPHQRPAAATRPRMPVPINSEKSHSGESESKRVLERRKKDKKEKNERLRGCHTRSRMSVRVYMCLLYYIYRHFVLTFESAQVMSPTMPHGVAPPRHTPRTPPPYPLRTTPSARRAPSLRASPSKSI
jgi:hypothetical protein